MNDLKFDKYADGLIPTVVQDARSGDVLMVAFSSAESLEATRASGRVTFYSRARKELWEKGATSGNHLDFVSIATDCDEDSILIKAIPAGPVCHTGTKTCFGDVTSKAPTADLLLDLETVIDQRRETADSSSYVSHLISRGINKIAQKVGEEAVELVIEAEDDDPEKFRNEAADLLFHFLILLRAKGESITDVLDVLRSRRR